MERPWLARLPDAKKAIAGRKAGLGAVTRRLTYAGHSQLGTEGFYQSHEHGSIFWTVTGGAQVTKGEMREYHDGHKGSKGPLGFPLTGELDIDPAPGRMGGKLQRYEGNRPYQFAAWEPAGVPFGGTAYWYPDRKVYATWGSVGELHEMTGGVDGDLGFPLTDETGTRHDSSGTTGRYQRFEGGSIYCAENARAFAVPSPIVDYRDAHVELAGRMGFPVSPYGEAMESPSPFETHGRYQRFQGEFYYDREITKEWTDVEGEAGCTVYISKHGTYAVFGGIGILYEKLGGTSGWLGFPKTDEFYLATAKGQMRYCYQSFEGGTVFWNDEYDAIAVPRVIMDLIRGPGLLLQVGLPVSPQRFLTAEAIGHAKEKAERLPEDADRIQFFEHGVVTVRNGVAEVWPRDR